MKKTILYILGILLFVSIVNAQDIPMYEQSKSIDLKVPCSNNNTACSPSAACNISIFNPKSETIISNEDMVNNNNGTFSFLITAGEVEQLGTYTSSVFCNDLGEPGFSTFDFEITSSGKGNQVNYLFFVLIAIVWLILIIGFVFKDYAIIAIAAIFLTIIGIYVLVDGLANFKNLTTDGFGILNMAIGFYILMRITWEEYKDIF